MLQYISFEKYLLYLFVNNHYEYSKVINNLLLRKFN